MNRALIHATTLCVGRDVATFKRSLISLTMVVLGALSLTTPGHAVPVSPMSVSYTGIVYQDATNGPLNVLIDGDEVTGTTLRSTAGGPNDPAGQTITFGLDADYLLSGIRYLGDDILSIAQGIENYTLTFLRDGTIQGTYSGSFANTNIWQTGTFGAVLADEVSLRIDSVFDGGRVHGSRNREFMFETSEVPIPAALPLFASTLGAAGILAWRRRRKKAAATAAA